MVFHSIIIDWYLDNKRSLPWRETTNPYHIWLSEIMLQQTRVEQGKPYYFKFLEAFPTVFHLASATEAQVLKLWQGLGYYSRARNLHATAKYVANTLNGEFPDNYKDLLKLKGVGDYTASAVASICFNEPTPVVDGNVYRVLSRYFGIGTPINSGKGIKEFKELANQLIDKKDPATFNQAIMEFGAVQCKPQNPYCLHCPLNDGCVALQKNMVKQLPVKLKKTKIRNRYFNYMVLRSQDDKSVLQERVGKGIWQNLYEFPLIETDVSINESSLVKEKAFISFLKGQTYDIDLYNEKDIVHKLSHQHIHTKFWIVNLKNLPVKGIPASDLRKYAVPVLIDNFLEDFDF